jgi:hypothetical protein
VSSLFLVALVAFGGVLFGFVVGGLLVSHSYESAHRNDIPLCYECRSRVAPEFIQEASAGYPECPVCSGNMLPPVGAGRGGT